jgi:hypothetical protein
MTPRAVIDTNIWIRILLKGRTTLPVLAAFNLARGFCGFASRYGLRRRGYASGRAGG